MDILNKLDPMPCGIGPAIKPAAKPTAAELREKELREFETKTDATVWRVSVNRIDWFPIRQMTDKEIQAELDAVNRMCDAMYGFRQTAFSNDYHASSQDLNRQTGNRLQGLAGLFY